MIWLLIPVSSKLIKLRSSRVLYTFIPRTDMGLPKTRVGFHIGIRRKMRLQPEAKNATFQINTVNVRPWRLSLIGRGPPG